MDKRYEEALERAKAAIKDCGDNLGRKKMIYGIFPELQESEDEKKRKRVIECLKLSLKGAEDQTDAGCDRTRDIEAIKWGIAYLEKQKEQKPVENTPIYEEAAKKYFDSWIEKHRDSPTKWGCFWEGLLYSRKLQPAEWSEEDERIRQCLIEDQEEALNEVANSKCGHSEIISDRKEMYRERIAWLKSRRPQPQWKPSEEQIKALDKAIPVCMGVVGRDEITPLESLYDDLKKL